MMENPIYTISPGAIANGINNLLDEKEELQKRIDKAIEKLKEHKHDLDYEPWGIYRIEGNILFDLVNILEGSDSNE